MTTMQLFIMFLLAIVGVYHLVEEIIWQVHKLKYSEEINKLIDELEEEYKNK